MKHRNTRRYAVKTSAQPYATIISSHCTLGEAYKSFVKAHKAHFRHRKFVMSQEPIAIIASEESNDVLEADIKAWHDWDLGYGPPSKRRLPLPIVVHQWNPAFNTYLRFGAPRA
jgi:hypothetical protein